jgi:hypothetical protein
MAISTTKNKATNKIDSAVFSTIADMTSAPAKNFRDGAAVQVLGYYAAGDGGGGEFRYDATSVAAANGGTVFDAVGGGRWERVWNEMRASYFGILTTATQTQFENLIVAANGSAIYFEPGIITCSFSTGLLSQDIQLIGQSRGSTILRGISIVCSGNFEATNLRFELCTNPISLQGVATDRLVRIVSCDFQDCEGRCISSLSSISTTTFNSVVVDDCAFLNINKNNGDQSGAAMRFSNNVALANVSNLIIDNVGTLNTRGNGTSGVNFTGANNQNIWVENCKITNIYSDGATGPATGYELHAIIAFGENVSIVNNYVENLFCPDSADKEAIYTKANYALMENNTVINGAIETSDGALAFKGITSMARAVGNFIKGGTGGLGILTSSWFVHIEGNNIVDVNSGLSITDCVNGLVVSNNNINTINGLAGRYAITHNVNYAYTGTVASIAGDQVVLDAGIDSFFFDIQSGTWTLFITSGTGAGQSVPIIDGDIATRTVVIGIPFDIAPDNTSVYSVVATPMAYISGNTVYCKDRVLSQIPYRSKILNNVFHGESFAATTRFYLDVQLSGNKLFLRRSLTIPFFGSRARYVVDGNVFDDLMPIRLEVAPVFMRLSTGIDFIVAVITNNTFRTRTTSITTASAFFRFDANGEYLFDGNIIDAVSASNPAAIFNINATTMQKFTIRNNVLTLATAIFSVGVVCSINTLDIARNQFTTPGVFAYFRIATGGNSLTSANFIDQFNLFPTGRYVSGAGTVTLNGNSGSLLSWVATSTTRIYGDIPSNAVVTAIITTLVSGAATIQIGDGTTANYYVDSIALSGTQYHTLLGRSAAAAASRAVIVTPSGATTAEVRIKVIYDTVG